MAQVKVGLNKGKFSLKYLKPGGIFRASPNGNVKVDVAGKYLVILDLILADYYDPSGKASLSIFIVNVNGVQRTLYSINLGDIVRHRPFKKTIETQLNVGDELEASITLGATGQGATHFDYLIFRIFPAPPRT